MHREAKDMQRDKGFTILELMIVVAILATIVAIALPTLLRSRMAANETACLGSLKTILTEEIVFSQAVEVDQDNDGKGEFGWFSELSGELCVRKPPGSPNPSPLYSTYLSHAFSTGGSGGAGYAEKSGFLFRLYLPYQVPTGATDDAGDDTELERCEQGVEAAMEAIANP